MYVFTDICEIDAVCTFQSSSFAEAFTACGWWLNVGCLLIIEVKFALNIWEICLLILCEIKLNKLEKNHETLIVPRPRTT